jgi:hypothetical protein
MIRNSQKLLEKLFFTNLFLIGDSRFNLCLVSSLSFGTVAAGSLAIEGPFIFVV